MSGIREKADAASSPESFESARDGVSCADEYNLFGICAETYRVAAR